MYSNLLQLFAGDLLFFLFKVFFIFLFISFVIAAIRSSAIRVTILAHWHHPFETVPFSTLEFYQAIKAELECKQVKGITVGGTVYAQGGIFSPKREYLQIMYRNYSYNICAAPFGTGYFVSWWLCEYENTYRDLFINLPLIGRWFTKREKTFFELDTEQMFKTMVTQAVNTSITKLTEAKGMRSLAETDFKELAVT